MVDLPSSYPTVGLEQVVPLESSKQYPRVPNMIEPLYELTEILALRKKTDLIHGTPKDTSASKIVAVRVTIKPGVAGRIQPILWKRTKR